MNPLPSVPRHQTIPGDASRVLNACDAMCSVLHGAALARLVAVKMTLAATLAGYRKDCDTVNELTLGDAVERARVTLAELLARRAG